MDRGLAVVLTIVTGAALATIEACSTGTTDPEDRPPYSTNPGFVPPVLGGTTEAGVIDAGRDADAALDADADAALDGDADAALDADAAFDGDADAAVDANEGGTSTM